MLRKLFNTLNVSQSLGMKVWRKKKIPEEKYIYVSNFIIVLTPFQCNHHYPGWKVWTVCRREENAWRLGWKYGLQVDVGGEDVIVILNI